MVSDRTLLTKYSKFLYFHFTIFSNYYTIILLNERKGVGSLKKTILNKRFFLVLILFLIISIYMFAKSNGSTDNTQISSKNDVQEKYDIISDKVYYVLVSEEFEKVSNDMSSLIRVYWCYDGIRNLKFLHTDKITIDAANSLSDIKNKLIAQSDEKALQLRPYTIVSSKVIKQWETEGYIPVYEYNEKSPEGLIYENLLNE